jgi:hypothetical protein
LLHSSIGAMSSGLDDKSNRLRIDQVFAEAVQYGAVFQNESQSRWTWQYDLTSMSFPVARAACRYILQQLPSRLLPDLQDLVLVTGSGGGGSSSSSTHRWASGGGTTQHHRSMLFLREYVQEILENDFDPGLVSNIANSTPGSVEIQANTLRLWIEQQQ